MATPKETHWTIEPHTRIKHLILRRYLEAWLPIMAKYNGRILFIDGFAGPGRYKGGEEGSPLIALKALLNHPHFQKPQPQREVLFLLIEANVRRAQALEEELKPILTARSTPPWVKVKIEQGEFVAVMSPILDSAEQPNRVLVPTFAFIDPFGFRGIPMSTIARIVRNPKCECLITFMYESINRFLAHPDQAIQEHFDHCFGTRCWRDLLSLQNPGERRDRIVSLYRDQLVADAGLKYVRTFEMVNQGNRTEYFLTLPEKLPQVNLQGEALLHW